MLVGKCSTDLGSSSAFSLPVILMWLGIQQITTSQLFLCRGCR